MQPKKCPHLLIVDDELTIRAALSNFLRHKGFAVTSVARMEAAQTLLTEIVFDLVVLDIQLPDGNGIDLLAEIRWQHPEMPVVILTGMGFQENLFQKALQLGAKGFTSKALPATQVLMEIRHALKIL